MKTYLLILFLCITTLCFGQKEDKALLMKTYNRLDSVNVSSIKTNYLLNKGFFFGQFIEEMHSLNPKDPNQNMLFMNSFEWKSIFMGVKKSGVGKKKSIADPEEILESYPQRNNIIPIGIIFISGEWLDSAEVEENINAVKKGEQSTKIYKQTSIIAGTPLQTEVFSTNITFDLSEELHIVDKGEELTTSIDFSDGNGFVDVQKGDKIEVKYDGPGEKSVAVRFTYNKSNYLVYSKILVTVYDDTEPDFIFDIGNGQQEVVSGRIESLAGGEAWLYNGCDRIFDKPVIIVEGFDPTNETDIVKTRQNYLSSNIDTKFRANGYDIIYLNFADGGATIQSNANVLRQLLIDVKQRKTGSQPITVIGSSMGGLVARYALKSMETQSLMHGVGRFISFDTPHLGANVPVGFQKLLEDVDDIDIRQLFNIAQSAMDKGKAYLNSPAAKQMLLRYKGASPHADFISLQNEFTQMGFPSQNNIRNINIINASSSGTVQAPIGNFNSGDLLLNATSLHGIANFLIKTRTNDISTSTKVSSIWITVGAVPTTIKDRTYSFDAFNYDISAGGTIEYPEIDFTPKWWQHALLIMGGVGYNVVTNYGRNSFSFVPLFSSMASTAPKTTQSHLNRSVSQLYSNNWTPFHATYSPSGNTFHTNAVSIPSQWINLLNTEFGITSATCTQSPGTMAPPPVPYFNTTYWYMCPNQIRNFYITNPSTIYNLYSHRWDISGSNGYSHSVFSDNLTLSYLSPGSYTITLIRTYSGGAFSNISTLSSRVLTVYPSNHSQCSGGGGGDPIPRLIHQESMEEVYALKDTIENLNEILDIQFWPNPATDKLRINFALTEASNLYIAIYPAASSHSEAIIFMNEYREEGRFEEDYDIRHLKPGLYVLYIQAGAKGLTKRLIIK